MKSSLIAEAFRQAKKSLWAGSGSSAIRQDHGRGKRLFICHAISDASFDTDRLFRYSAISARCRRPDHRAIKIVNDRLGGYLTLEDWVRGNIPGYRRAGRHDALTWKTMQDFRHRWLDALIVEFSK